MAGKSKPVGQYSESWRLARILLRPQNRGPVFAALVIVAALIGLGVAWNRWGVQAMNVPEYRLTAAHIVVSPPPDWIHTDVKAEVVRSANLAERNLRDPALAAEIAAAFALHPWVAQVKRVEKQFPAHVEVKLEYRRPVAAVEIADSGDAGLLFVDANAVLLPSSDFAQSQAADYLRIAAGTSTPAGGYGSAWGSDRVAGAAKIAAAFGDRWRPLALYRIAAVESAAGELTFELRTKSGARVVWGVAPGREASGEPAPEQKIVALEHLVADKGPLDRTDGPPVIDLRTLGRSAGD